MRPQTQRRTESPGSVRSTPPWWRSRGSQAPEPGSDSSCHLDVVCVWFKDSKWTRTVPICCADWCCSKLSTRIEGAAEQNHFHQSRCLDFGFQHVRRQDVEIGGVSRDGHGTTEGDLLRLPLPSQSPGMTARDNGHLCAGNCVAWMATSRPRITKSRSAIPTSKKCRGGPWQRCSSAWP